MHTDNVNTRCRTELCWEVAQIHPCGQAPECFLLQRPEPEASTLALDIHVAVCDMRASRHARTFLDSLWCPQLPSVGIHSYLRSFDIQRARTSMAETHAE